MKDKQSSESFLRNETLKAEIAVYWTTRDKFYYYPVLHLAKLEMWIKSVSMNSKLSPNCSLSG